MREAAQLDMICRILEAYPPGTPLSRHLKAWFLRHRNMGSSDRRRTTDFVYNFFRARRALGGIPLPSQVAWSNYLCSDTDSPLLQHAMAASGIDGNISDPMEMRLQRIRQFHPGFQWEQLFPCPEQLSSHVDKREFILSQLSPPWLWLRAKRKKISVVTSGIEKQGIAVLFHEGASFALPPRTRVEEWQVWKDGDLEIQDYSSQQAAALAQPRPAESWWDACAASGGKSLALLDAEPSVRLSVSDIRPAMLTNLEDRFRRAGCRAEKIFSADLEHGSLRELGEKRFKGIIADVPCSGSGTWARMPEWLSQFSADDLPAYAERQFRIASNCYRYLETGGCLVYLTCSAFAQENEETVRRLAETTGAVVEKEIYFEGWKHRADTMYGAVLRKPA